MSTQIDIPGSGPVTDDSGPTRGWLKWFRVVTDAINALRQSGTTAQRPTVNLWVGRPYYDTTLETPVWWDGSNWVNGSGTTPGNLVTGYTNVLVNGSMRISQRQLTNTPGTTTSIGNNPPWYFSDQWRFRQNSSSGVGILMERDTTVPSITEADQKFWYSSKFTVKSVTVGMPTSSYRAWFEQQIESSRFSGLMGKQCTLTFWIRGSVTGVYTVWIDLPTAGYVSRRTIEIETANTWEQKTIIFDEVPDVSLGSINDYGATLGMTLAAGSTLTGGSQGAEDYPGWNVDSANGAFVDPSQVNFATTANATLYVTGFDLRAGTTSDIEVAPIEDDLQWCMRYFEKSYEIDTPCGTVVTAGAVVYGNDQPSSDTYALSFFVPYRVPKRTAPTYSVTGGFGIQLWDTGSGTTQRATRLSDSAVVTYNSVTPSGSQMGFGMTHTLGSAEADTRRAFHWAVSDVVI